jgi:acyl-CoA synthetase (AMP-forming)/AMP-acid ligase II
MWEKREEGMEGPQSGDWFAEVTCIADIVRFQARHNPLGAATWFEGRATNNREFDRYASRVANGILAEGCAPQCRIALLTKNSDQLFEIFLGTAKTNTVVVGVNSRLAPPEVEYLIADAAAEILFVGAEYLAMITTIADRLPTVRKIIVIGEPGTLSTRVEPYETWRDRQSAEDPSIEIAAEDVAVQLYTSGTSGHPKGVQLTNANLLNAMKLSKSGVFYEVTDHEIFLVAMPGFHVSGLLYGLVAFAIGGKAVIVREVDTKRIIELMQQHHVTQAYFVPAALLMLLRQPGVKEMDWSHLALITYGASPMPADLLKEAVATFGCSFGQCYGMTETSGTVVYLPPADHDVRGNQRMRSCGKPVPGTEIRIVDGAGNEVESGAVGEITVRSPLNMKGYWKLPEATASTLKGGWLRTGDAGYRDNDGYIYIYDRVKDMIVSGAENIYPAEVESALFGHPAIADVAVIGVPDAVWGEAVKAVIVLKPGASATPEDIIAFAKTRIAGYKAPKTVDFTATLPRNPAGKLLKRELRKPYWEGRERQVN